MCLSHFEYYLFAYCVIYANWFPDGYEDYIISITHLSIQISSEFRKWLIHKVLIWKILNYKYSDHDHLGNNLDFLSVPIRIYCYNLFNFLIKNWFTSLRRLRLWKEPNECFLYFFLKSLFFAMLGILTTPLLWWLKCAALCTLAKSFPLLKTTLPLSRYLESVYRQVTRW